MADTQLELFDDPTSRVPPVVTDVAKNLSDMLTGDPGSIALAEALRTMDLVDIRSDGVLIMADRSPEESYSDGSIHFRERRGLPTSIREMGYTAPSPFTSWTRRDDNTKLQGQSGLRIYYNMRRQDGAIRGAMHLLKTPVMGAHWFVEPWQKNENTEPTASDKNIAEFVERDLFQDLHVSWSTLLGDILLMLDYGYMAFEKVWEFQEDGKLHLSKLAPRHPLDIQEWLYDREGGPDGCVMYTNPYSGQSPISQGTGMGAPDGLPPIIPIDKLVVFTHEPEAGDLSGLPILRSMYKHWYYKDTLYKIDAIQKERHGIGVPIIKLPPGFTKDDQIIADNLGRNLRTNERAHVTLPPLWELIFAKLEGQPVDCMKSIDHHDLRIKSVVLGGFLDADGGRQVKDSIDIFMKSTRYIADAIADIFNKYVIPQMVQMNFKLGTNRGFPQLRARRLGEWDDLRTLSFAIRNMVGADVIRADDRLEASIRREMDLPAADPSTARIPAAQQMDSNAMDPNNPGGGSGAVPGQPGSAEAINGQKVQNTNANSAGGTRQRRLPPSGPPAPNAGVDRSGGK